MTEVTVMTQAQSIDVSAEPLESALSIVARSTRYLSPGSVVDVRVAGVPAANELLAWCRWAGHAASVQPGGTVVSVSVRAVQRGSFLPR